MERDHRPLYAWVVLVIADALLSAYYWPRLPEVLAQHFDAAGYPNGWAPKHDFLFFMWFIIGLMGAVFFLLPKLLRRLPFALLNIPYKQYWSAPERQALAFDILETQMNWIGAIVAALLTVLLQMVFAANTSGSPRLDGTLMIAMLVVFAAAMLGTTVALFRRFRPPK